MVHLTITPLEILVHTQQHLQPAGMREEYPGKKAFSLESSLLSSSLSRADSRLWTVGLKNAGPFPTQGNNGDVLLQDCPFSNGKPLTSL